MRGARLTALLCAGALVLAGCGAGDDGAEKQPDNTKADKSAGEAKPQNPPENVKAETKALKKVSDDLMDATVQGDARAFCKSIQPVRLKEAFQGLENCIELLRPQLKQAAEQFDPPIPVKKVEFEAPDRATVHYSKDVPPADFYKVGGRWYPDLKM